MNSKSLALNKAREVEVLILHGSEELESWLNDIDRTDLPGIFIVWIY